jgi:hypothetical protein
MWCAFSFAMDPNKPMETINAWQQWYKTNQNIDKESDKGKATSFFADSICTFTQDLTGSEAYECLLKAATDQYDYAKKEYEYAKEFLKAIGGNTDE